MPNASHSLRLFLFTLTLSVAALLSLWMAIASASNESTFTLGEFEQLPDRLLENVHPNAQGVQVGDFYYVVSGEIQSRGIFTPEIERTKLEGNGNISLWEEVGTLPSSQDQAAVAATDNNICVLGDHPGSSLVRRVPVVDTLTGDLGAPTTENGMSQSRFGASAFVHEAYLYVVGGFSGTWLASVERALINPDGTLEPWYDAGVPDLNQARTSFALVKGEQYVWAIGGSVSTGESQNIERAQLLIGGDLGPWEDVTPAGFQPLNAAGALFFGNCILLIGGHAGAGTLCLRLDGSEDIVATDNLSDPTERRLEPDVFTDGSFVFVTAGQENPGPGKDGWQITERVPIEHGALLVLIDELTDLNLQIGIENSLNAMLDRAHNFLEDMNSNNDAAAVTSLQAFINAVEAQRGNNISEVDADTLIFAAEAIIALLSG